MSPDLFNIYSEMFMRAIESLEGNKIGGKNITNVGYGVDTTLIEDFK